MDERPRDIRERSWMPGKRKDEGLPISIAISPVDEFIVAG
jgi:hypothetical protein